MKPVRNYSADFETTTEAISRSETRVWAWAVCPVDCPEDVEIGIDIESFIEYMEENNGNYYFHNAGFDAVFIMDYLLRNGYECNKTGQSNTFDTLISKMNKLYQVDIVFENSKRHRSRATIKDSYKKIPSSVEQIANDFKIPCKKLSIDYDEPRPIGHILTDLEKEYIKHDVQIIAYALQTQFDQGLTKLTVGSDALSSCKDMIHFSRHFPTISLDIDGFLRRSYRGGYTYLNQQYKEKTIGEGIVYDVNSLYPAMMMKRLPVGMPYPFSGEYNGHKLYVQSIYCMAKLKYGKLPTLLMNSGGFFQAHHYVESIDEPTEVVFTSVDLAMFFGHYDVQVIEYCGGYEFDSAVRIFEPYIKHWMDVKNSNTGAVKQLAKLMLNSLYGKLATNPDVTGRYPVLDGDKDAIEYVLDDEQQLREPVYTAAAAFVTAYARETTITACQEALDQGRFIYADTDSMHLVGDYPIEGIRIHPKNLGEWKHESSFEAAKFLRAKTYLEVVKPEYRTSPTDNGIRVTCAGLRRDKRAGLDLDSFYIGATVPGGKLVPRKVHGGVILHESDFVIRDI